MRKQTRPASRNTTRQNGNTDTKLTCKALLALLLCSGLTACNADGSLDSRQLLDLGVTAAKAATLTEEQVVNAASLAAAQSDRQHQLNQDPRYTSRLDAMATPIRQAAHMKLDFKIYQNRDVNAFAMADGTVRVYSGLMDAMPDDQVMAVLGHEIGHVALKHSYDQAHKSLMTELAMKTISSLSPDMAELTESQLGALATAAIEAHFSQQDELEADRFSVQLLRKMGKDPHAMESAIQTLEKLYGSDSSFLSSHPSNDARIRQIQDAIEHP